MSHELRLTYPARIPPILPSLFFGNAIFSSWLVHAFSDSRPHPLT